MSNVIIELMHSFEVIIRICQPENSDVDRALFLTLTNPDVNRKRTHQLFCYMTLSPFSYSYLKYFHIHKLFKSDVPSALNTRLFQQLLLKFLKANELHFLNYCFHKMNKF